MKILMVMAPTQHLKVEKWMSKNVEKEVNQKSYQIFGKIYNGSKFYHFPFLLVRLYKGVP
jgi:hypothetical protein